MNQKNTDQAVTNQKTSEIPKNNAQVSGDNKKVACCKFQTMIHETKKIITIKDTQINELEQYLSMKENQICKLEDSNTIKSQQIAKLEDVNRALLQKIEDFVPIMAKKMDDMMSQVHQQNDQLLSKVDEKISHFSNCCDKLSDEKIDKLAQAVEKIDKVEQQQPLTREETQTWQTQCQQIMLGMAEKMESIEQQVPKKGQSENPVVNNDQGRNDIENPGNEEPEEIIIIGDSNRNYLKPELVHRKKKVSIEKIYTLESAIKDKPERTQKQRENVTDVVFISPL